MLLSMAEAACAYRGSSKRDEAIALLRLDCEMAKFSLLNFGPRFRLGCYMGLGRGLGSILSDVLLL